MYKVAGTAKYPYGAISSTDATVVGLGYPTTEAAQRHADVMNELLETYPHGWNIDVWKTKPGPWIVFKGI